MAGSVCGGTPVEWQGRCVVGPQLSGRGGSSVSVVCIMQVANDTEDLPVSNCSYDPMVDILDLGGEPHRNLPMVELPCVDGGRVVSVPLGLFAVQVLL